MMCQLFRMVSNGFPSHAGSRARFWLRTGACAPVAPGIDVRAFCDSVDGEFVPYLQVGAVGNVFNFFIADEVALNLTPWVPLLVVPRAVEVDRVGRVLAVLLEQAPVSEAGVAMLRGVGS